MIKTSYPNYDPSAGYMTEKIQQAYISNAIKLNVLPMDAHRMPEIVSLVASNNLLKPIQFWQLFSVLGQNNIVRIVHKFYDRVYRDEPWFTSVFARIGDASHHVRTQASMWLDVMGGGFFYHGAEFRLNFHHQHNAFQLMNREGAIAKQLMAVENAMKPEHKNMCYLLKYDDFVLDPENHLKNLYKFLNIEYYPHYFENLKQIDINGVQYNDKVVGSNMHKVWSGKVRKIYNPYIEKIPERIRKNYGHIKF